VEREITAMVIGEVAKFTGGAVGGGDWGQRTGGKCEGEEEFQGGCGETNSAVGSAGSGMGGVGSANEGGGGGGGLGMGGEEMKTAEELKELVREAVGETLRKKVPILDEQRLGADLGAESIDRIDLTFRFEEALGKALEDKILFAEPDPSVAELAERLRLMLEEKR